MAPTPKAYILLLLTSLFWGGNAVAGKLALGHVSPMLLTTGRWGVACLILAAIGWPRLRHDWPVVRARWPWLVMLGMLGFALFNILLYTALLFTTAINVSIEQAGIPMVIFVANFLLFGTRVSGAQIVGFLISIAGVLLTASHGDLAGLLALDVNSGDALMMLAVLLYGAYTVALRAKPAMHWQSLMIAMTFGAFVTSIPFAAGEVAFGAAILPDMRGWAVIAYTAIFPSILGQIFFIRGVELIGGNRAGLFINLVPICGTLLSILVVDEAFHAYHAVAMVLVLGGIWLAEHRRPASA